MLRTGPAIAKVDYRNLALDDVVDSDRLDRLGWDNIAENCAEGIETIEDARMLWKSYQHLMFQGLNYGQFEQARFHAWAMVYVEKHVASRFK